MKKLVLLFLFFLTSFIAKATTYYVAANGSDANNGTSSTTPWKTLVKLSAELGGTSGTWGTISTGDRVLFRKGDVFRGSIAFAAYNNDGITFDSYGSGALPIIKGSNLVTTWTVHSGSIWKATLAQRPYFLYVNSTLKTLARAPDVGTWNLSAATANSLTSNAVGSSGKNFVGANVCVREYDWRLNRQVVTTQSGNTVNWATAMSAAGANANFYFDNKLDLLDTEGEWFWDAATATLYYMSAINPNTSTVEASTNLLGVAGNDNRSNNTFQNLQFEHFGQEGIRLMGSANGNTIQNCVFSNNFQAIFVSGSTAMIQNNTITDAYYQGAVLANMANGVFINNTITNVGMAFGQHRPDFTGDFYSGGVWLINGNSGCIISNNTITNIGNIGIRFGGEGITVERNQVANVMVNMDDGGGIYTWGGNNSSHDNIVRNNIVDNLVGSHNGAAPGNIINGIYIDNEAYRITVANNTVKNIPDGSGIIVNAGAHSCPITNNVTYKCKTGLGFYDWQAGQSIHSNTATGNTFYANLAGAIPIEVASNDNNYAVMTAANNNFLSNPYGTTVARYIWSTSRNYTLAQWRTATGLDAASVGSYYTWTSPTDNSFLVTNSGALTVVYDFSASNIKNLNNQVVESLVLQPFTSQVLINLPILPLELLSFNGKIVDNKTQLDWSTANEINVTQFDVERSWDGQSFTKIVTLKRQQDPSVYQHFDALFSGITYYRLKIVDNDGKTAFSKTISLKSDDILRGPKIYPNPAKDVLFIDNAENKDVQIINALGQTVISGSATINYSSLNISHLKSGVYFVKVGNQTLKFIKE